MAIGLVWISYALLIVPLFALANAGVDFRGGVLGEAAGSSLTWAIVLGLVPGRVLGISAAVWLAVRTGLGRLPAGVSALHVVGVAAVAGIGVHSVVVHFRPLLRRRSADCDGEDRHLRRFCGRRTSRRRPDARCEQAHRRT
jgi:Na+/H+ antiporter NhaA